MFSSLNTTITINHICNYKFHQEMKALLKAEGMGIEENEENIRMLLDRINPNNVHVRTMKAYLEIIDELGALAENPCSLFNENEKQITALKFLKHMFSILTPETPPEKLKEIKGYIENLHEISIEDQMPHMEVLRDFLFEITLCQKLFNKILPAEYPEEGHSKGILYKIKKQGITCGYLFGTIHNLDKERQEAAKLSPTVYEKLCKCSTIGTEIKLTGSIPAEDEVLQALADAKHLSVESKLLEVAKKRGIVNFGIDANKRAQHAELAQNGQITEEQGMICTTMTFVATKAYEEGNIDVLQRCCQTLRKQAIEQGGSAEVFAIRDTAMAQNIHTILEANCEVGTKLGEKPPKTFFAVGIGHFFDDEISESLITRLGKMGLELSVAST